MAGATSQAYREFRARLMRALNPKDSERVLRDKEESFGRKRDMSRRTRSRRVIEESRSGQRGKPRSRFSL
jgi:hypothetical protein